MHVMASVFFKNADLALDDKEAKELAKAVTNVSRHYDTGVTQLTLDWVNLATVAGMVYGSRIIAARQTRAAKAETPAPDVTQSHAAASGVPFNTFPH